MEEGGDGRRGAVVMVFGREVVVVVVLEVDG